MFQRFYEDLEQARISVLAGLMTHQEFFELVFTLLLQVTQSEEYNVLTEQKGSLFVPPPRDFV